MTDEERKRIAAERKAAYRKRKKEEALAGLSNNLPKQTPQELAIKVAKANGLPIFESTPNPDQESAWKRVQPGKIAPLSEKEAAEYVSNRERAAAIIVTDKANLHELEEQLSKQVSSKEKVEAAVSEAVAREEYVNHLFSPYAKVTNIPQLLQAILREQITLRVTLTDLIGSLRK